MVANGIGGGGRRHRWGPRVAVVDKESGGESGELVCICVGTDVDAKQCLSGPVSLGSYVGIDIDAERPLPLADALLIL